MQVRVTTRTGRDPPPPRVLRLAAAVDTGQVIKPVMASFANQSEGADHAVAELVTVVESVSFDATRITSNRLATYPILRCDSVPDRSLSESCRRPNRLYGLLAKTLRGPPQAALANAVANAPASACETTATDRRSR